MRPQRRRQQRRSTRFPLIRPCSKTLRVWDPESGECLRTLVGHQDSVTCCAPLGVGCVVSGGTGGSMRVWSCETSETMRVLSGHTQEVSCIAVQADGAIVSGSHDCTLRVHDPASAEVLRVFTAHSERILAAAIVGEKCASSDGRTLLLWETATGRYKKLEGHKAAVTCIQGLGDERAVSASLDQTLRIWSAHNGACIRVLQSFGEAACSLCIMANGNLVAGAASARNLFVLDADSHDILRVLHDGLLDATTLCALDDDRVIAASLDETVLRLWNTSVEIDIDRDSHGEPLEAVHARLSPALDTACPPPAAERASCLLDLGDGRVASADSSILIWDAITGACLSILALHTARVTGLCALDGCIISGSADCTVAVWDSVSGALRHHLRDHHGEVLGVCALGNSLVASCSADSTVAIYDIVVGERLHLLAGHTDRVTCICATQASPAAPSPGGGGARGSSSEEDLIQVVSGSADTTVRVWNVATGACRYVLRGHTSDVSSICVLGDPAAASAASSGGGSRRRALVCSSAFDSTLRVWDVDAGVCLRVLDNQDDDYPFSK